MKKIAAIFALLAVTAFAAVAQNNAYDLDDECFVWFQKADQAMDDFETDAFEDALQMLLETSLRKKDTKAQTLYYVEKLKHTSHEAQAVRRKDLASWDRIEWNSKVDFDRETVQRIARATGYMQYYYYATELCQTYYYNTSQDIVAATMLSEMMEEAEATGDEYASWKALTYLSKLYLRISDQFHAQKILLEVVDIYEHTQDPTILRQTITNQLSDLADTYPVASDSARLFYHKAELVTNTKVDSVRIAYYNAQLAAWDGKLDEYRAKRDYCLSQYNFSTIVRTGDICIDCIDNILDGKPVEAFEDKIAGLNQRQQMAYLAALAEHKGQWKTASVILNKVVFRLSSDIYRVNEQRLEELAAQYGNNKLSADLARASQKVTRVTVLVAILLTVILVSALFLAIKRARLLKRTIDKDEAIIADLQTDKKTH